MDENGYNSKNEVAFGFTSLHHHWTGSCASPKPVDDFQEHVLEELDDQDEEEGQSEPEENDSKQESGQEIISKDAENYDDNGVQDAGNNPIITSCRFGFYPHCTTKKYCKAWSWGSNCRTKRVCGCRCLKVERYYKHCTRRWGIFKTSCTYQQRFVCRKTPCPKRRRVARICNFRRIYVIYCG